MADELIRSQQATIDKLANAQLEITIDQKSVELLTINGNYPGIDGFIQLIKDSLYTGKYLFYQLKGVETLKDFSFTCETKYLKHWAKSNLPVIVIVVDLGEKKIFWEYVDQPYIQKLQIKDNQKYKTIKLDPNKEISPSSNYLQGWYEIAASFAPKGPPSAWENVFKNLDQKIQNFIGVLYLLGPITEENEDLFKIMEDLLGTERKSTTIAIYEGIKRNLLKNVGGVLILENDKAGTEFLHNLLSQESLATERLWTSFQDEKLRKNILKRLLIISHPKSDKFLDSLSDNYIKEIKKWKSNEVVIEICELINEFIYKVPKKVVEIAEFLVHYKNPPQAKKTKIKGFGEVEGKSYNDVLLLVIEMLEKIRYYETEKVLQVLIGTSKSTSPAVRSRSKEAFKELARYNLPALQKIGFQAQGIILNTLGKLSDEKKIENKEIIIDICAELLTPSFEGQSMQDYKTFSWSFGPLKVTEGLKEIRVRAMSLLKELYPQTDFATKKGILQSLNEATHTPRQGNYGQDIEDLVVEDTNSLIEFYITLVFEAEKELIKEIEEQADWFVKRFTRDRLPRIKELESIIAQDSEYEMFRIFFGFDGKFEEELGWEEAREFREKKIQEFIDNITPDSMQEWEKRILATIKNYDKSQPGQFQYFSIFLTELGKKKPTIAADLITKYEAQLESFLLDLISGILQSDNKDLGLKIINSWIEKGKHLTESACIYLYPAELDIPTLSKVLSKAIQVNDTNAIICVVKVSVDKYNGSQELRNLLISAIKKLTEEQNPYWVFRLMGRNDQIFRELGEAEVEVILKNMILVERIDHNCEDVLKPLAESFPINIINFFEARLKRHISRRDYFKYDAIPYKLYELDEVLRKHQDQVIPIIMKWYNHKDYIYNHEASQLLKNIYPSVAGGELEKILLDLIKAGGKNNAVTVISTLRAYDGETFVHNVCKEFIKKFLQDPKGELYKEYKGDIFSILSATGVVWGEYGMSDSLKRKKDEIQDWKKDTDPIILGFVEEYEKYLDSQIEFWHKRADVDIALMKKEYGS